MPILNKLQREKIVKAILADCETEFDLSSVKASVEKAIAAKTPPEIAKILKNPNLAGYVQHGSYVIRNLGIGFRYPHPTRYVTKSEFFEMVGLDVEREIDQAIIDKARHDENIAAIKRKLEVAVASSGTDKRFAEDYPQYAKYLPERCKTLPAVLDLDASLKSIGYPKP